MADRVPPGLAGEGRRRLWRQHDTNHRVAGKRWPQGNGPWGVSGVVPYGSRNAEISAGRNDYNYEGSSGVICRYRKIKQT